jgi:hypothetical protein
MVFSRAARKAWNVFGALGAILGLGAAILAGIILGGGEALGSALLTTIISLGILFVVTGIFFIREPVTIYNEQQSQINDRSEENITENSIDISHFATSAFNSIELKYVTGNEPVKVLSVKLIYLDKDGQNTQSQVEQFYSSSSNSMNEPVNLSVLNIGEGVRFYCPSKDDTNEVIVKVELSGIKTKNNLVVEKIVQLKPNQVWLSS